MLERTHPKRLTNSSRALLFAATALAGAVLVAGCGGGSGNPPVAAVSSTTTSSSSAASSGAANDSTSSTTTGGAAPSSDPSSPGALEADELAYSRCMRAHGVPDFPDPSADGGFRVPVGSGASTSSPTVKAAQTKCTKLLPGGGLPGRPGSGSAPSTQTLAHWVTVARCMRRHGVPNFPDPTTTFPSQLPNGGGVISDRDGAILVFPHTIDEQSPLFTRAAARCGFQLTNH